MKKHLLTKKRALISSVAMLLVAMIALGTATFAWFTSSTEAYADDVYVRTTKVSNLQLNSKLDTTWRTHVQYGVGASDSRKKLTPVSTVDGVNWYYAEAVDGTKFAADTATKYDTQLGEDVNVNDYYFADQINIKNAGQAECADVKIKIDAKLGDYGRIAIVPVTEAGGSTIDPIGGKTKWSDYIIDKDGKAYKAATGTTLRTSTKAQDGAVTYTDKDVKEITPTTSTTIEVGDMAPEAVKYFNVYVWFEGQDEQCTNANSGQFIPGITLTVDGTAKADQA